MAAISTLMRLAVMGGPSIMAPDIPLYGQKVRGYVCQEMYSPPEDGQTRAV